MLDGLSPRVRGNRQASSITSSEEQGVYPRVYGETSSLELSAFVNMQWVYPRVYGETRRRSGCRLATLIFAVYPRVYGETALKRPRGEPLEAGLSPRVRGNPPVDTLKRHSKECGLSPRVRGNQCGLDRSHVQDLQRSIPACTGKPYRALQPDSSPRWSRVYPRVYGETVLRSLAGPLVDN